MKNIINLIRSIFLKSFYAGEVVEKNKFRTLLVLILFTFLFSIITIRILFLAITGMPKSNSNYKKYNSSKTERRLRILDRNGEIIASDISTYSLYLNRYLISNPKKTAQKIATIFDYLEYDSIYHKLISKTNRAKFILIKRNITPKEQQLIKDLEVEGFYFKKDLARVYPQKNLFSHTIGFVDTDRNGISGLEKQYDTYLKNTSNPPLITSLDVRIQSIMRSNLLSGIKKFKAKGASAVMTNINSGEILGIISLPDFNPNLFYKASKNSLFNRATVGVYEMGSVFKVFTIANGLDKGIINYDDIYNIPYQIKKGAYKITDTHYKKKRMSVEEILVYSSNVGIVQIADDIGIDFQKDFLNKLGLTSRINTDFPSLSKPVLPKKWREINNMTIAYGHGIAVSSLHLIMAAGAILNDGVLVIPRFTLDKKYETRKVISKKTSNLIKRMMRKVVTNGTGWRANISGYVIGGKTGTAEKIINGEYSDKKKRLTFISAFPMNNPQYALFVMIDEGDAEHLGRENTGGSISGEISGKIIKEVAPLLKIKRISE